MNDPELEELFADPAHREVVDLLKTTRPAAPPLDPHFRNYLRAKLMTEAQRTLQPRTARPWFSSLRPKVLAPAMAAVAAGFLVVLAIEVYQNQAPPARIAMVDPARLNNKTNVATAEPIVIPFTGPVDKNAVAETVVIEPATSVTKQWVGQNLVIIPDHPLAPNTTYTVSLTPKSTPAPAKPNIIQPTPTAAPTPVVMRFTTVPAPVPPVVPPSFKSSSVRYGHDSRLADSGTVFSATWTPTGQLLVTRPAGQPGLGSVSPSPATSPSGPPAPKATTDVWLMSALSTPIRLVVPGGSLPAAAPSGGLLAAWRSAPGSQATLDIWDLQGNLQSTVATVDGAPDRPAVWLDSDRIAYLDKGTLKVAGLHAAVDVPKLKVDHGSLGASATGQFLAVESADRSVVIDLATTSAPRRLPDHATGFAWSSKGDLAFLIQQASGTELWVASGGVNVGRVATSPAGQTWSDLNWAPDGASLMLASKPAGAGSAASRLMLINADGSALTPFAAQQEYSSPQWASHGDFVLFTRQDEAGGRAFWLATTSPLDVDAAEKQALAEVEKFMQARLRRDIAAAQDGLDAQGRSAYDGGASTLLSPAGTQFDRYYPVTIQKTASNPNKFLVGVRIFVSHAGAQRSFFEEQLTLVLTDQRYLVDAVTSTPTKLLSHGPTVLSVEVVQASPVHQVRVRFDADLRAETVTEATILVKDADGKPVSSRITFDPDNHLATLTLKVKVGSTYQLAVTTGVADINGVNLAQEYDAPLVISR
jgi:Big-like domain-containing protein